MADLSYTVEVKGVQDLDRLENTIDKLHSTLNAGKGAGKSLEEVRKIVLGLKGSEGIFTKLEQSVRELGQASAQTERAVKESIGGLSQTLKSEMLLLRQTMLTAGITAGKEATTGLAKGIAEGEGEVVRKVKGAAAKARAVMTAEYNKLVGDNGLKPLTTDEASMVAMLKHQGATISTYHARMVSNYEDSLKQQRRADNTFYAEQSRMLQTAQQQRLSLLNAQVSASKLVHEQQTKLAESEHSQKVSLLNAQIALVKKAHAERLQQEAAEAAAARKSFEERAKRSVAAAINAPSGAYQVYNPTTGMAGAVKEMGEATKAAGGLNKAFQSLTISGNDTHSMARGLASGFNLLWLTWGNLAPLFAGAVVSNGFMQTAKSGMEVAHTLAIIENIGGNTAAEMDSLTKKMIDLGKNGPFGPKEVADAMQVLSLAGLKANDILAVTNDVLNFSVAGTTDLKTAADTLVSVSTAFGMGSAGFGRVGDVISKAAAESKTSVESFANAMKTASVINAQYGVSLEDTATALATMSQLGIEGTAAGTALRNMYADLSGRSAQVAKILRQQGIELRDTTGQFRPMIEVVADLNDKFNELDGISQKNLMQALLSERGAKGLIEMLRLIRTEAKDTGAGFSNALEEVRASIEESYGFAAINAAKMSQTVQSQYKAVGATLKTTMFEAYQEIEPVLYLIAQEMKESFASPEFKQALTDMVRLVALAGKGLVDFGEFVLENNAAILTLTAGYVGFRVAASAIPALLALKTAATSADTAATVANTGATLANNAAKAGAVGLLGTVARLMPGVGTVVTVAGLAWAAYSMYMGEATLKGKNFEESHADNVIKSLEAEADRLEKVNKLRATGITLAQAQAQVQAEAETDKARLPLQASYDAAKKAEDDAWAEYNRRKASGRTLFQKKDGWGYEDLDAFKSRAEEASKAATAAWNKQTETLKGLEASKSRVVEQNKRLNDWMESEQKAKADALKSMFGEGKFEQGAGGRGPFERAQLDQDNELRSLQSMADQRMSVLTDAFNREKRLLDQRRSGELVSESEYLQKSMQMTAEYETSMLSNLESASREYMLAYSQRLQNMQSLMASAQNPQTKSVYAQQIEREMNDMFTQMSKWTTDGEKIRNSAAERIETTYIKLASETGKLIKADKDFWTGRTEDNRRTREARELQKVYSIVNDSIFSNSSAIKAQAEAEQKVKFEVEKHNEQLKEQLKLKLESIKLLKAEIALAEANGVGASETTKAMLADLEKTAANIKTTITNSTAKGLEDGARAGFEAFEQERLRQGQALRGELADAIVSGITGSGKDAGRRLRDILQRELMTKPLTAIVQAVISDVTGLGGKAGSSGSLLGNIQQLGSGNGGFTNWSSWGSTSGDWLLTQSTNLGLQGYGGLSDIAFSLGDSIKGLDTWLKDVPGMSGGIGSAAGYLGAIYSASQGQYGAAIGSAIGTYILPGIGTMIGSMLGGLADSLFAGDSGTSHMGAGAIYAGGKLTEGKDIYNLNTFGMGASGEWNSQSQSFITGIAATLGASLDVYAKSFGQEAGYTLSAAFADDSSGDGAWGSLKIADAIGNVLVDWNADRQSKWAPRVFSDGEEGVKEFLNSVALDVRDAFLAVDAPKWAENMLSAAKDLDTLNAALNEIGATKTQFQVLSAAMDSFKDISEELQTNLLNASGGIANLSGAANSYYSSLYTEQERMLKLMESQAATLSGLGLDITPAQGEKAKQQFRKAVDDALSAGQAELAYKLLAMGESFAQVADYAQNAADTLRQSLIALEGKFSGGGMSRPYQAADLASQLKDLLSGVGIAKDESMLTSALLAATQSDVESYFREIWSALNTDEARQELVSITEAMLGLANASGSAKNKLQTLADNVKSALDAMNTAGSLLDRISEATGGPGNQYDLIRQQRLWSAMVSADYKTQIELAGELTNSVLSRYQIEQQAAQKQIDFARSLRDYVDSLKIGNLSPLTTGEKLAEAAKQYQDTLSKARGGDENAMQALQGASSAYLDLARTYFASSGEYTRIFASVTGALDNLGISAKTEAQQQLEVSSQSLGQLRTLQTVLETAYSKAAADYTIQKAQLQAQIDYAAKTASGIEAVVALLQGLPAEIGLRMQTSSSESLAQEWVSLMKPYGLTKTVNQVASELPSLSLEDLQRNFEIGAGHLANSPLLGDWTTLIAKLKAGLIDGSHYSGLDRVPFDGYIAELHAGETVLTAKESSAYRQRSWNSYEGDSSVAELVSEIRALKAEVAQLRAEADENAKILVRATVESNHDNAAAIVSGVSHSAERSAYASSLNEGRKYR